MCEPFPQSPPELWGQLSRWLEEARLEEKGHQCSLTIILISRNNSPSGGAVLLGTLKGDEMFSQDMTEMRCSSVSACALQCSWLENPRDGGAWWAAVYGVTQSRIRGAQGASHVALGKAALGALFA